jgi:hypothetical protein
MLAQTVAKALRLEFDFSRMVSSGLRFGFLAGVAVLAIAARADSLQNGFIQADFGPRGLTNVTDLTASKPVQFNQDEFYVSVGSDTFLSSSFTPLVVQQTATNLIYQFSYGQWTIQANYELEPSWHFVSKRISISTAATTDFVVNQMDVMRGGLTTTIVAQQSVNSGSLLRFNDGNGTPVSHGLFLNLQTAPQYAGVSVASQ